jgi:hypothetical protein
MDTFVLRNSLPGQRLTNQESLMLGKLGFLSEFREQMPKRDRHDDQLSFLIYLGRAWGWPVWIPALFYAPGAALRRFKKWINLTT